MFACIRKDRLTTRTGSPYLALELRDRTRHDLRARVPRRRRAGRAVRARRPGAGGGTGRAVSRRAGARGRRSIARVEPGDGRWRPGPVPADAPTGTSTSSTGSSSTWRARSTTAVSRAARCAARRIAELRAALAPGAVQPRRAPRVPRRAARAHGCGGDARLRGLPAASAAELRPAADGGDHPRPRAHARVHLRRRVRADRRGPAARPPGDRRADAVGADAARWTRAGGSRCCTACSATTVRPPRPAGASPVPRRWPCIAATRSTRPSRARSSRGCRSGAIRRRPPGHLPAPYDQQRRGTGLVAHPVFKTGRAGQPPAWKVRFLRRVVAVNQGF